MATNTYVALATQTVSSPVASVTFSSIPQGYTDLVLVANAGTSTIGPFSYQVGNGSVDTGSNYSRTCLYGDGTSAASFRETNQTYFNTANGATTVIANDIVQFMNYSNTTTNKTILDRNNNTSGTVQANVYLWRSTAAIDTIKIFNASGYNLIAGSTFTIYGVANTDKFAYATGGYIYQDSTYWYHVFAGSGTFTPKQTLTCDYLVVAGGGGGGSYSAGGGGGAGGLRSTVGSTGGGGSLESAVSMTSGTAYTITIGAGGAGAINTSAGTSGGNSSIAGTGLTTITSTGGGYGGGYNGGHFSPASGGSGGGGNYNAGTNTGASGTANQGYAGGNGVGGAKSSGGGGGGAGAIGGNGSTSNGGDGGNGVLITALATSTNTGVSGYYAGGGGGASYDAARSGYGGLGGGGNANGPAALVNPGNGYAGVANTGSGGGAAETTTAPPSNAAGGAGGSGVVIIRYAK